MDVLKDEVTKVLESKGILAKMKAQLRASVFTALEEDDNDRPQPKIASSPDISLAADLIREFMDFYELDYSLSTFTQEARLDGQGGNLRQGLEKRLDLSSQGLRRPLLLDVIQANMSGRSPRSPRSPKGNSIVVHSSPAGQVAEMPRNPTNENPSSESPPKSHLIDLPDLGQKKTISSYLPPLGLKTSTQSPISISPTSSPRGQPVVSTPPESPTSAAIATATADASPAAAVVASPTVEPPTPANEEPLNWEEKPPPNTIRMPSVKSPDPDDSTATEEDMERLRDIENKLKAYGDKNLNASFSSGGFSNSIEFGEGEFPSEEFSDLDENIEEESIQQENPSATEDDVVTCDRSEETDSWTMGDLDYVESVQQS